MRDPYETLLGQYHDHWFLRDYLDGGTPRIRAIQGDERWWCLSDGERAMVTAAAALLQLNECWLAVDEDNRARILTALQLTCGV